MRYCFHNKYILCLENRIKKEPVFQEPPLIGKGGRVPEAEPEEEPGKPKASPSPGETSPATAGLV